MVASTMEVNLVSRFMLFLTVCLTVFSSASTLRRGVGHELRHGVGHELRRGAGHEHCTEPEPHNDNNNREESIHGSFYLIPSLMNNANNLSSIPHEFINTRRSLLAGERNCPSWEVSVRRHGGSVCPYHYVLNYDNNRHPNSMVEIACNCVDCLREDGSSNALMNCHPVLYHVKVSRRTSCRDGVYVYADVWEPLTVGCQCAHKERVSSYQRLVSPL